MRRPRARSPFLLLLLAAAPAGAQQVVTSTGPERVAVTLYRDPTPSLSDPLEPDWLEGFALISETRRIAIPAGESEIRFEGVAGGIVPQSAIVTGLPDGIVERNRDALLLSAGTLIERTLGRRVHLRRTSRADGTVREQDAIVRSGADGAVVLQTRDGFEALRCTGLAETPLFGEVPPGLSARPTLSVRTRAREALTATVTLSYLASGFDWRANYIATLSPDGSQVALFAWLTLASGDETSFVGADAQAVAGRLNREEVEAEPPGAVPLQLRCWPQATTSDIPLIQPGGAIRRESDGIVDSIVAEDVSALPDRSVTEALQRIPGVQMARQEALGDLKLYRIPEPVTVAAHSIKQVAFLERNNVPIRIVYRHRLSGDAEPEPRPADRFLIANNRTETGLGMPLPAGQIQLFAEGGGRPILVGEGVVTDQAVGAEVEIGVGPATGVNSVVTPVEGSRRKDEFLLTVTNDQSTPVPYEAIFHLPPHILRTRGIRLPARDGRPVWTVTIPAHGSVSLRFQRPPRPEE
jgi:hypothetical protein